jgi:hypothetical protein
MTRAGEALAVLEGIGETGLSPSSVTAGSCSRAAGAIPDFDRRRVDLAGLLAVKGPGRAAFGSGESGLVSPAGGAIGYAVRYETKEGGQSDEFIAFFRSEDGGNWSRPVRV